MMPLTYLLYLAGCFVTGCGATATQEFVWLPACPRSWTQLDRTCYHLDAARITHSAAVHLCTASGAQLLSVNSAREKRKIVELLLRNDHHRQAFFLTLATFSQTWHTSAGRTHSSLWEWKGDGTLLDVDDLSVPMYPATPRSSHLTLRYVNDTYHWYFVLQNPVNSRLLANRNHKAATICEVSREQLGDAHFTTVLRRPPETYGKKEVTRNRRHRHPEIIEHPRSAVHFEDDFPRRVILGCKASGTPTPEIVWYRGSAQITHNNTATDAIVQVNGALVFHDVIKSDLASYHCLATNKYGTARSLTAELKAGYIDEFPTSRLDVYATAGEPRSIPCEPPQHYPHTVSFAWTFDESSKTFVRQTQRVFLANDGTLHFSYLVMSDAAQYSCSVVNNELQTGHYGPFFRLIVNPEKPSQPKFASPSIPTDFIRMMPAQPTLGSTVRLECFAYGRPSPTYEWSRIDGASILANNSAEFENFNRVLVLRNLSRAQLGAYHCKAINPHGSSMARVEVHASSRPIVVSSLGSKLVAPNSTVSLICDVISEPPAEFEWFHDGVPISPLLMAPADQTRIHIDRDRLVITNTQHRDSGVYQCHAHNQFGEVNIGGFLVVRGVPPEFPFRPTRVTRYAVAGSRADLICAAEAEPAATVLWRQNGRIVNLGSGRFTTTPGGGMRIFPVISGDGGLYSCTAANHWGGASADIQLVVLPQLTVVLSGEDVETVSVRSNFTVICTADFALDCSMAGERHNGHDQHSLMQHCPDVAISWSFNGRALDSLPQFAAGHVFVEQHIARHINQLKLVNVDPRHHGIYMCRADLADVAHATATVSIRVAGLPLSPMRVRAHTLSPRTAQLAWMLPPTDKSRVQRYRLETKCENETQWTRVPGEIVTTERVLASYNHSDLPPSHSCRVRVAAKNDHGWSVPSLASLPFRTFATAPAVAPQIRAVETRNPGVIVVRWKALRRSDWNDRQLGYKLEWAPVNASFTQQSLIPIENPEQEFYVIHTNNDHETGCVAFRIGLRAYNGHGNGPQSRIVTVATRPRAPTVLPRIDSLVALNATAMNISWSATLVASPCYAVSAFRLECTSKSAATVIRWFSAAHGGRGSADIVGFQPQALYSCSLRAVAADGKMGPISAAENVRTEGLTPTLRPTNLRAEFTDSAVYLYWMTLQSGGKDSIMPVAGYQLSIYHGETSTLPQRVLVPVSSGSEQRVKLIGLRHQAQYRVRLRAFTTRHSIHADFEDITFRFGAASTVNSAWTTSDAPSARFNCPILLLRTILFCCLTSSFISWLR